jgi:hypothetical protein
VASSLAMPRAWNCSSCSLCGGPPSWPKAAVVGAMWPTNGERELAKKPTTTTVAVADSSTGRNATTPGAAGPGVAQAARQG